MNIIKEKDPIIHKNKTNLIKLKSLKQFANNELHKDASRDLQDFRKMFIHQNNFYWIGKNQKPSLPIEDNELKHFKKYNNSNVQCSRERQTQQNQFEIDFLAEKSKSLSIKYLNHHEPKCLKQLKSTKYKQIIYHKQFKNKQQIKLQPLKVVKCDKESDKLNKYFIQKTPTKNLLRHKTDNSLRTVKKQYQSSVEWQGILNTQCKGLVKLKIHQRKPIRLKTETENKNQQRIEPFNKFKQIIKIKIQAISPWNYSNQQNFQF